MNVFVEDFRRDIVSEKITLSSPSLFVTTHKKDMAFDLIFFQRSVE
jgi:hypothetical protein